MQTKYFRWVIFVEQTAHRKTSLDSLLSQSCAGESHSGFGSNKYKSDFLTTKLIRPLIYSLS